MGQRKVTILEPAADAVAQVAFYIESEGMPVTAKKFIDDAFGFFESLADKWVVHRPCGHTIWKLLNFRCSSFRKKYTVAYLENSDEIIICDFSLQKLIK